MNPIEKARQAEEEAVRAKFELGKSQNAQSIITGPTGDAKIDSLRASIMGTEAATAMRHKDETAGLTPLKEIKKPLAFDRLVAILKKKGVPFTLVALFDTPEGRHAEFINTIEHPNGADLIHATVEANRAAFWSPDVAGIPQTKNPG